MFGYELDLTKMTEQEKQIVRAQIDFYKQNRKIIQNGIFYRLQSPFVGDGNETSWMVVSQDQKQAIVGHYQVLSRPNPGFSRLLLKGLKSDTEYIVSGLSSTHYGDDLMYAGLQLKNEHTGIGIPGVEESGDFSS